MFNSFIRRARARVYHMRAAFMIPSSLMKRYSLIRRTGSFLKFFTRFSHFVINIIIKSNRHPRSFVDIETLYGLRQFVSDRSIRYLSRDLSRLCLIYRIRIERFSEWIFIDSQIATFAPNSLLVELHKVMVVLWLYAMDKTHRLEDTFDTIVNLVVERVMLFEIGT